MARNVILPGIADLATLNIVSAVAGETDIRRVTTTGPTLFSRGHASRSVHLERRPRLPVAAIAQGTPGQAILLTGTRPTTMSLTPWFADPFLRQLLAAA